MHTFHGWGGAGGGCYEAWQEPSKGHIQRITALKVSLFLYLSLSYRWRTHAKSAFSLNLFWKNISLGSREVRRRSTNNEETSELRRRHSSHCSSSGRKGSGYWVAVHLRKTSSFRLLWCSKSVSFILFIFRFPSSLSLSEIPL